MITFRPYDDDCDAKQMVTWLNTPHVYAWWGHARIPTSIGGLGEHAATVEQVQRDFGMSDPVTHYYIIEQDGKPIGEIQWCVVDDYAGYPEMLGVSNVVGIDLLIGELSAIGKGIGTEVIRQFTLEVALPASGMTVAVADPELENVASWRAFEKAGYHEVSQFVGEGGHICKLMVMTKLEAA